MKPRRQGMLLCCHNHLWYPEEIPDLTAGNNNPRCPECAMPLYIITAIDRDGYEYLSHLSDYLARHPYQQQEP